MRVYVAGPMTGYAAYNVAAFKAAAALLASQGHKATTPFDANSRVWRRYYDRPFDPFTDKCDYGDPLLREMTREDIAEISCSDAIALLPGWEKSKGTRVELLIALNLGLTVLDAATGAERTVSVSSAPWAEWADERPPAPSLISQWLDACVPLTRGADGTLGRYVQQDIFENSYDGKR